jgi:hypothetical protein
MINMYEMLMLMLWNVNACLTLRGVTPVPFLQAPLLEMLAVQKLIPNKLFGFTVGTSYPAVM